MTLNEIIYDVLGILYGGNPEDDISITEDQVKVWIDQTRALLIRQMSNAGKPVPSSAAITFCFAMELVDASICCGWEAGCKILRSTSQLPASIPQGGNTDGILMVATPSGGQYGRSTMFRARWDAKSPFAAKNPFYFFKDNYLYINSDNPLIKVVEVTLLPEDPIAAMELDTCKDPSIVSCDDKWDAPYPLPIHMVEMAVNKIVKDKGMITRQVPEDSLNDGRETT